MRLSIAPLRCQRRRAHGHGLDHGRSALQGHCGQGRNAASLRGLRIAAAGVRPRSAAVAGR
jgi:hypothetical protein